MPTMAKDGMSMANGTWSAESMAANAPPIVAPINSDGEKIPPEEPDPRLSEVASSLQKNSSRSSPDAANWPTNIACTVA